MARRSRSEQPTAQTEIDKFNAVKSYRRLGYTFNELEKLCIGEGGWGFPDSLNNVQRIWGRRRTLQGVLSLLKRYSNKSPEEVRASIRNFDIQRETAAQVQQFAQAGTRSTLVGQPVGRPQHHDFGSDVGNRSPLGPQPAYQQTGTMVRNTAAPAPATQEQTVQVSSLVSDPLPSSFDAECVAPLGVSALERSVQAGNWTSDPLLSLFDAGSVAPLGISAHEQPIQADDWAGNPLFSSFDAECVAPLETSGTLPAGDTFGSVSLTPIDWTFLEPHDSLHRVPLDTLFDNPALGVDVALQDASFNSPFDLQGVISLHSFQ